MNSLWFFLPAIILVGIFTSYTDIKFGKIRNKHILFGFFYLVVVNGILVFFFNSDISYVYLLFINVLIASVVSIFLWESKLWSAGDAKLFIVYSGLLPLTVYSLGYINYFPSGVLFINTFVPLFLFMSFHLFFKTNTKQKLSALKSTFNIKLLLSSFISVFAIFWAIDYILFSIGLPLNYFFSVIFSILIFYALEKKLKHNLLFISLLIIVTRLFIDQSVYSLAFVKDSIFLFLLWVIVRGFIENISNFSVLKKINIANLEAGMFLSESICVSHGVYSKNKNSAKDDILKPSESLPEIDRGEKVGDNPWGLSKSEIRDLKQAHKEKKLLFDTVLVHTTVPFASYLFAGVVITIAVKGNLFVFLLRLFG